MAEELKTIDTIDTSPFKKLVMTIGELPTSFVDSMTYYELLAWLCNYLQNTVIPAVNNNAEVSEELQAKFIELRDYVDNYFTNLDVQEEINNKLDSMAEAGTLQEIITAYIQANVAWTFDTVADMKAATNLVNGSYARTLGFHTINDGGGAIYKILNTGTANEMDIISVSDLFAHLTLTNPVNPMMFGATGDGLSDDAPTIRAALTYLQNIGGGTLDLLDNKTYLLNSTISAQVGDTFIMLKNNCHITGTSTLKVADNFGDYNSIFSYDENLTECSVENITIDANTTGNNATASTGNTNKYRTEFYLSNNTNTIGKFILKNVTINDTIGKWQLTCNMNKDKFIVDGAIVNYNTTANISYDRTSFFLGADNAIIENCILDGGGKGITAIELHGNNNIASNNIIKNYEAGILCAIDNTAQSFYANNDCQQVNGNQVRVTKQGILFFLVDDTTNNLTINNVKIVDNYIHMLSNNTLSVAIGFSDSFGQNGTVKNIDFCDNTIISDNPKVYFFRINCPTTSRGANNVVENLNIKRNNFYGVSDTTAFQITSPDKSKLLIKNININDNNVIANTVTQIFSISLNDGVEHLYFNYNDIRVTNSFTNIVLLNGTFANTCDVRFIDNRIHNEVELSRFIRVVGTVYPLIKQYFKKLVLTTATSKNELQQSYVKMANGSELSDTNVTVKKFDDKYGLNYVGDTVGKHLPVYKGTLLQMFNDTNVLVAVTHAGYLPDHEIGTNLTGEWVLYNNQVFQSLTDNNLTTASDDNVNFKLIGTYATLSPIV